MADDPLIGQTVGRWRVTRLLGAGGMGRVYEAVQPEIGARVAIKVLRRESLENAGVVERFFNEARAVNMIRHEAIIDVIDLAHLADGSPYIVMEYLDGASLAAVLRRQRPLPLGTLARIVGEVLAALESAHAKAIVHRDLKPDNVFLSPSGRVTVLDFGIAKLAREHGPSATHSSMLLGTPAYMAPEQARSQSVDARADLYSAGVMLYEGATGQLPFIAANLFDLLKLHVEAEPAPPRTKRPELPEGFEAVILRALAKDPDARFASAAEMRAALAAAAEGLPVPALAIPSGEPARKPPSDPFAATAGSTQATGQGSLARGETVPSGPQPVTKRTSRAAMLAIAGGAAALAVGVTLWMSRGRAAETAPPAPAPRDAGPPAPKLMPDGSYELALPHLDAFDPIAAFLDVRAQVARFAGVDIHLYAMDIHDFDVNGHMPPEGIVVYFFSSAKLEVAGERYCEIEVRVEHQRATMHLGNFADHTCERPEIAPLRCSFAQLLDKARAAGLRTSATSRLNLQHPRHADWMIAAMGEESDVSVDDDCR